MAEQSAIEKEHDESPANVPDEEQGIEQEKTGEERKEQEQLDRETGKKDEEVYDETGREKLVEDAEIESREEGFSKGYEARGKQAKCGNCGKPLDEDSTIEREVNDEIKWFCSDNCVQEYLTRGE